MKDDGKASLAFRSVNLLFTVKFVTFVVDVEIGIVVLTQPFR